jgi:O-antigen ligase
VALGLLAAYVLNEVRPRDLVAPLGVMVAVQACIAIAQAVGQRSLGLWLLGEHDLRPSLPVSVVTSADGSRTLRGYGLTDHPNILGGVIAFALLPLAGRFLAHADRVDRRRDVATGVVFALGAMALFVTFSRSAWLALGAGLILLAVLLARRSLNVVRRRLIVLVGVGLVASAPLVLAFWPSVLARTGVDGGIATETRSIDERAVVAAASLDVAIANPLLGVGIGALPTAIHRAQPDFAYDVQPASIVALDAAAETGVAGGLLYLLATIAPWVALARRRRAIPPELAIASSLLAAVALVGLFDYYTWTYQPGRIWLWLAFGLWAGAWLRATEPDSSPVADAR